ncbi:unnamed protein product [Brassica rapa]|uniref:Jacalin-type lectin domain-containing protein n=2 Tax=Brassica TaxID=3705 RepID=A0A3P5ZCL4_BRACM|nr:unnamed protein product [Brassica napus]CAG7874186.1 unnamed protein product [Brassica rapa]VDC69958.1 unnamed protein product [Brassica rapa]
MERRSLVFMDARICYCLEYTLKTLRICQDDCRIIYLEFEYVKARSIYLVFFFATQSSCLLQFFVLEDGEYLTAVEASYIAMAGTPYPKVASLRFKTNKRESALFGINGCR